MDENTARGIVTAFIEKAKKEKFQGLDEFETKRSQRKALRTQLSKNVNHLQNAIDAPTPCIHTIKVIEEKVTKSLKELTESDEYNWSFISHYNDDAAVEADELLGNKWYSNTYKALAAARKSIIDLTPPAPVVAPMATPAANLSEVRLPKMELPTFAGSSSSDYHSWVTQFNNLIHTKSMPNHQKLLYLKTENCRWILSHR